MKFCHSVPLALLYDWKSSLITVVGDGLVSDTAQELSDLTASPMIVENVSIAKIEVSR